MWEVNQADSGNISTIHQFRALASHKLDGMEGLIDEFKKIISSFKNKGHDLLGFDSNKFDRDYVEFNVPNRSELEGSLQDFINASFDSITDIEQSLELLKRFQQILQRERLKSDLDSKFNVIFQNYGKELEKVQQLYEKSRSTLFSTFVSQFASSCRQYHLVSPSTEAHRGTNEEVRDQPKCIGQQRCETYHSLLQQSR